MQIADFTAIYDAKQGKKGYFAFYLTSNSEKEQIYRNHSYIFT